MFGSLGASTGRLGRLRLPHVAYRALLDLFTPDDEGLLVPSINDARAEGKLWQDSGQTTRATGVDDPVGYIEDYSGNGNALSQSTAAARPLLKQDGGGNWYLQFDGTDDHFDVDHSISLVDVPFVCAFAWLSDDGETSGPQFLLDSQSSRRVFGIDGANLGTIGFFDGAWNSSDIDTEALGVSVANLSEGAGILRHNGVELLNDTGYSEENVNSALAIGSRFDGSSSFLQGRVYAVLLRFKALSAAETSAVESYFASQSGVTL